MRKFLISVGVLSVALMSSCGGPQYARVEVSMPDRFDEDLMRPVLIEIVEQWSAMVQEDLFKADLHFYFKDAGEKTNCYGSYMGDQVIGCTTNYGDHFDIEVMVTDQYILYGTLMHEIGHVAEKRTQGSSPRHTRKKFWAGGGCPECPSIEQNGGSPGFVVEASLWGSIKNFPYHPDNPDFSVDNWEPID